MNSLIVDYVSDLHLSFYIKAQKHGYNENDIEDLIDTKIAPKVNGEILVIAGDISEIPQANVMFVKKCLKYYKKVIYVAGNHEYYYSYLFLKNCMPENVSSSIDKISYMISEFEKEENAIFLDSNSTPFYEYKGFKIAGDTLWYYPQKLRDWYFYYAESNDSRLIRIPNMDKKDKIASLHKNSISWYNNLPDDIDLIVTHIPPVHNPQSPKNKNGCYHTPVSCFKAKTWIYGHDHIQADFHNNGTRFLSNPWGYTSVEFPIASIELTK